MAQYARPDNDDANPASWTPEIGGTLYGELDEAIRDDADFVGSAAGTTGSFDVGLSAVTEPTPNTGHELHYVIRRSNGAKDCTIVVTLFDNVTQIDQWTHVNPANTLTLFEQAIAEGDAANITTAGYAGALKVRVDATVNQSPGTAEVSWIQLEVPDALDHYTLTPVDSGTYAFTGATVGLELTFIPAGSSYAVTGADVGLDYVQEIVPAGGSYDVTGATVDLERDATFVPAGGTYGVTGASATTQYGRIHDAGGSSYAVTGATIGTPYCKCLSALGSSYALTGAGSTLEQSQFIDAATDSYAITGADVTMTEGGGQVSNFNYVLVVTPL